jgi:hypothetical protein
MSNPFSSSSSSQVSYLPEQISDIKNTNAYKENVVRPGMTAAMQAGQNVYQNSLPGIYKSAQNLAGTAGQVQQTTGEIGESMARQGATGLQSLFGRDYEANQIQSALAPAQAQYQQNITNQGMNFGGAGNLGSARQALAGQQMAGANAMNQAQIAAQVQQGIANQRADVGKYMTGAGSQYLNQALGAAGTGYQAAAAPQQFTNQYMQGQYGMPAAAYNAQYPGQQSTNSTQTPSLFSSLAPVLPFLL